MKTAGNQPRVDEFSTPINGSQHFFFFIQHSYQDPMLGPEESKLCSGSNNQAIMGSTVAAGVTESPGMQHRVNHCLLFTDS